MKVVSVQQAVVLLVFFGYITKQLRCLIKGRWFLHGFCIQMFSKLSAKYLLIFSFLRPF